ncbi:MAG TPA: anti-sigma factor [Candidatus Binataceae bacterium]|nr:anti-sigma factor [Candidatus Binataceae bacterium]
MTHEELKALLPLAALERLEPEEEASLREHLAGCVECDTELRELEHAVAMLALAVDAPANEDRVTRKIEARLATPVPPTPIPKLDRPPSPPVQIAVHARAPKRSVAMRFAMAAVILLALYGGGATYLLRDVQRGYNDRGNQLAYLENRFNGLQADAQKAEQKADALAQVLSERVRLQKVFSAPDLQITRLAPLPPAPGAHALVAVSRASGDAVIEAGGLSPPPNGKIYELWWITRQKGPVPAGLFSAESGREVIAKVDPPPAGQRVMASAVTLEAVGGVPKPTGAMYLKGSPERE